MIRIRIITSLILGGILACMCSCQSTSGLKRFDDIDNKIKVVVVTGGHGFEHDPFFAAFDSLQDMTYVEAVQKDHSELFENIDDWPYDVIVLYNMTQNISPQRRENFKTLLNQGVGLLAMHHSLAAFQDWDEYKHIIGAKYYTKVTQEDGQTRQISKYKHDLDMTIYNEDPQHPITIGMSDFHIFDEAYGDYWFDEKENHLILGTDHPENDPTIGWVRKYGKARVCYLQLGHDAHAYRNGNFRWLVQQAIRWCAGALPEKVKIGPAIPSILPGLN